MGTPLIELGYEAYSDFSFTRQCHNNICLTKEYCSHLLLGACAYISIGRKYAPTCKSEMCYFE